MKIESSIVVSNERLLKDVEPGSTFIMSNMNIVNAAFDARINLMVSHDDETGVSKFIQMYNDHALVSRTGPFKVIDVNLIIEKSGVDKTIMLVNTEPGDIIQLDNKSQHYMVVREVVSCPSDKVSLCNMYTYKISKISNDLEVTLLARKAIFTMSINNGD